MSKATSTSDVAVESLGPKGPKLSKLGFVMALPPILVILTFVGFPIYTALTFSLGHTGGFNEIPALIGQDVVAKTSWWGTLDVYKIVWQQPNFVRNFVLTLIVTAVSTTTVLFLAIGIGLYQRMRGGKLSALLASLAVVPLFIPVVIAAWAIFTFYSGDGFMRSIFALIGVDFPSISFTPTAIVVGSIWTSLPFCVLMVASGMQAIPDALIESARDAGAGFFRIVISIMLPLAFISIVIAGTFTAIGVIGSFTVPYFLGPNVPTMLGVEILTYFSSYNRPQQSVVMAFFVFMSAAAIAVFYVWANFKSAKSQGRI